MCVCVCALVCLHDSVLTFPFYLLLCVVNNLTTLFCFTFFPSPSQDLEEQNSIRKKIKVVRNNNNITVYQLCIYIYTLYINFMYIIMVHTCIYHLCIHLNFIEIF